MDVYCKRLVLLTVIVGSMLAAVPAFAFDNASDAPITETAVLSLVPTGEDVFFSDVGGFLHLLGGFLKIGGSFASVSGCAYATGATDGCGVSPGIYFAPAIGSTTQPTAAQWGSYARQSGQTWDTDHPQPFNVAAVDYGVGPNVSVSSLTDIAAWPAGQYGCTFYATGTGTGITGWPAGDPVLVCKGSTQTDFSISGYNFGPTAYQGNPVGTHDCVNLVIQPNNTTTYTPNITISGNAFINGATCAPFISGVRYGLISAVTGARSPLKIWNNYVDGRANDSGQCCTVPNNQGFFVATTNFAANIDTEFNYVINMLSAPLLVGLATGNESAFPCSNGTAYNSPGYVIKNKYNYYDQFGAIYGGGHWEISTIGSTATVCGYYPEYNTVVWANSTAAEGTSSFFHMTTNAGTIELSAIDHNTIVTNLVAGKSYPDLYEYYNWHTDAGTPNHIVVEATGSSCTGLGWTCSNPVRGQAITGGTNMPSGLVIGLQNNTGSGPITGSAWNGGCNATLGTLCPNSGNWPSLAAGVSIPSNYPTSSVLNSMFNNRVVSEVAAEADHGTTATGQFGYGVLRWTNNYIDGGSSGTSANNIPQYWSANPATTGGGYQLGGGGGCAVPATISGNVELRTGGATAYPQVNQMTSSSGGC